MKPATPLPWGAFSLKYAQPLDKSPNTWIVNQVEDEQYALHACNAYPKLVEALHKSLVAFMEVTPTKEDYENIGNASNLLRELGEIK